MDQEKNDGKVNGHEQDQEQNQVVSDNKTNEQPQDQEQLTVKLTEAETASVTVPETGKTSKKETKKPSIEAEAPSTASSNGSTAVATAAASKTTAPTKKPAPANVSTSAKSATSPASATLAEKNRQPRKGSASRPSTLPTPGTKPNPSATATKPKSNAATSNGKIPSSANPGPTKTGGKSTSGPVPPRSKSVSTSNATGASNNSSIFSFNSFKNMMSVFSTDASPNSSSPPKSGSSSPRNSSSFTSFFSSNKTASTSQADRVEKSMDDLKRDWSQVLDESGSIPFSNPKVQAKCRKLAWDSIPPSIRTDAWVYIIGNDLHITEDLFNIMSTRAQEVKALRTKRTAEGTKDNTNREESIALIDKDVSRTFPELKFFHDDGPLQEPLYTVLETYACYRPDMGYVQGMSYIAATLLLNMEQFQAFVALANLLNQDMYFKFFRMNAAQMRVHLDVFDACMKEQLPTVHARFEKLDLQSDMYLYDWFLTIFSRGLPLDITHRIWDNFLCWGHTFLFRTGLGLLRLLSQPLPNSSAHLLNANFEECLNLLQHVPSNVNGDMLFECIGKISITEEKLTKMLREREKQGAR